MSSENGKSSDHLETPKTKSLFRFQVFASLTLFVLFVMVVVSGAVLYISPRGRVANWGQWTIWGWDKESWAAFHINTTLSFALFSIIHLLLNWKMFFGYLKRCIGGVLRGHLELLIALIVGGLVFLGTVRGLPPFSHFVKWRESFKDYWERTSPPAAIPHMEEFTMARIAELAGVPEDEVIDFVKSLGIKDVKSSDTLAQVAAQKATSPREVFQTLADRFPALKAMEKWSPGQGRRQGGLGPESQNNHSGFGPGSGRGGGRGMGQGFRRGQMRSADF